MVKSWTVGTLVVRLRFFLVLLAVGVWMAACSGAVGPVPAGPGSEKDAASSGAMSQGASPPIGGEPEAGSPPAAPKPSEFQPRNPTVADRGQGGVTVKATWVTSEGKGSANLELDRYLAFDLAMDTHSGSLSQYDLKRLSTLRDDRGKEAPPAGWQATSDDSHHREGVLRFARGLEQGSKYLELVIRDVAGVKERVLRWDLVQQP